MNTTQKQALETLKNAFVDVDLCGVLDELCVCTVDPYSVDDVIDTIDSLLNEGNIPFNKEEHDKRDACPHCGLISCGGVNSIEGCSKGK